MTIYDRLMAKAAEWREYPPMSIVRMHQRFDDATELEALAREVCAEARLYLAEYLKEDTHVCPEVVRDVLIGGPK